jgi:hypothetical protein
MADKTLLGQNDDAVLIRQPDRYGWSRGRGDYLIRTWRGTAQACLDRARIARASGIEVEVTEAYGLFTITETFDAEQSPLGDGTAEQEITWEFDAAEQVKDLLEANLEQSGNLRLTKEEIKLIRAMLEDDELENEFPAQSPPAIILALEQRGVRERILFAPTIRGTQAVSIKFSVENDKTPLFANVNRILRTETLFVQEGVPRTLLQGWPGLAQEDPEVPADPDALDLAYGWLKKFPKQTLSAFNRNQIAREYNYGLWSTFLYGEPIGDE